MLKKATAILLTLIMIISTMSAVSFTASAANNSRMLMVSGNHLVYVDDPETTVRLTGVNVPGGEWTGTPGVERIDRSVTWAIDNWNANLIRLPVSINGWTGNYSYVSDGGKGFRNYIDSVIQIASERGAYVILDLHHYTSFNKEAYITFWKEAAVKYANNPTVLFGILNEPHSTTWDVWRNGDGASVYGHQYVVEMIRDLGAKNIIVAGGLDWAYKLGGVADGYALVDQGTNNNKAKTGYGIMYDSHVYPWKGHTSNWDSNVGAARKLYPVLIGECGWDAGTISEIGGKNPQPGDPLYHDKWCPELLAWFDDEATYGAMINYTAYCMHPSSAPQLIVTPDANGNAWKDAAYSYSPTEYWGAYLVPHLQASVNTRYGKLDSIKVDTMSVVGAKTTYNVNEAFDKSTGYLAVEYSDGTSAQVALSDENVTITGFNSSKAAESQTITVAYGNKTATYTIVIQGTGGTTVTAQSYLDLDFEDAAYQKNSDGTDNYAVIETTNKATGNKIGVNFYNSSDTNRYQVYTENDSKYVATKGRKTNSAFDFRPEQSVSDKTNKVYVEMRVKRVSYNVDDPCSIVLTDDSNNIIFRLNYKQNAAPVLVANSTYETVTYPINGDWTYVRAIIDFNTSTFELYQGTSLDSLTGMVSGTTTFGFASNATNLARITNYGIGDRKGSLGFDDIKIYTVGQSSGGEVTPVTLSSISVSGAQTSYAMNDTFVAPTVTAKYSDGSSKTVTGAVFSGYDMSNPGTQTVTVSYGGKTTTYQITVAAPEKVVESLTVSNAKTQYTWGDAFVAPTVTASYTDKYYEDEVITDVTFVGYNMNTVSSQTVRVVYGGKTMTSYTITVSAPEMVIDSISVSSPKTDYIVGDAFVAPSVIVKYTSAYYSSTVTNGASFSGYNMNKTGTQTVTASYGGKTTTYQITVSNEEVEPATLESIAVSGQKTGYNKGDAFVAPTVIGTYSDGTTKTVTGATFSGYNMNVAGTQTVTVTYEGKKTTYQITVTAPVTDTQFIVQAGSYEGKAGVTSVEIPLRITKMYTDKMIGGLTVEVNYDPDVFTFDEADWTNGSMVVVPADVILNVMTPGLIRVMFTSATDPISPAMVAADNLFGTVKLGIKDPTAAIDEEIVLTTNDDLYDDMANTLIAMDDMGPSLLGGRVVIEAEAPVTLSSIKVSGQKTEYTEGDAFVKPTVTATYSDGSTKTVNATFSGYDMNKAGTQTVTVTYEGKKTTYQITVAKAADFVIAAGKVTGSLGDASVTIPLNITKMYTDKMIGGLTVEVNYDPDVFTFDEADWINGSMVVVPADVILNVMTPGLIRIMFTSATDPITADMVAADNLFGTVKLGIKDTSKPINETITLTTNDDLYDDMANTLIAMDDMSPSLQAGSVVIGGSIGFDATVITANALGYEDEGKNVLYIKYLVLSEGNGQYKVKVGDDELVWSPERKCYVGITAAANYDAANEKLYNVSVESSSDLTTFKYGDVSIDGRINATDLSDLKECIEFTQAPAMRYAADANLDGRINATDFNLIKALIELEIAIF